MHAGGALRDKYISQSKQANANFLIDALKICNKYELGYKGSSNKNLHVEVALLEDK